MAGTCTVDGCSDRHLAKGMCNRHYHAATRHKYLDRIRAANRRNYEANREERIAAAIAWNKAHPGKAREVQLRWQREHPERMAAADRRWRQKHPDKVVEKAAARRVRRARVETTTVESSTCAVCRLPLVPDAPRRSRLMTTVGHEPPLSRALLYSVERPEHLVCNLSKGTRLDSEMTLAHVERLRRVVTEARAA
jgi:hypothetical protein